MALPAFTGRCCSNRSISAAHWVHSSKPAAARLLLWAHAGTDRQTDTVLVPFHRSCSTYYVGSASKYAPFSLWLRRKGETLFFTKCWPIFKIREWNIPPLLKLIAILPFDIPGTLFAYCSHSQWPSYYATLYVYWMCSSFKYGQPWASCSHMCAFVTTQYNLLLVKGQWCPAVRKVTVGLVSHWPGITDFNGLSTYGLTA